MHNYFCYFASTFRTQVLLLLLLQKVLFSDQFQLLAHVWLTALPTAITHLILGFLSLANHPVMVWSFFSWLFPLSEVDPSPPFHGPNMPPGPLEVGPDKPSGQSPGGGGYAPQKQAWPLGPPETSHHKGRRGSKAKAQRLFLGETKPAPWPNQSKYTNTPPDKILPWIKVAHFFWALRGRLLFGPWLMLSKLFLCNLFFFEGWVDFYVGWSHPGPPISLCLRHRGSWSPSLFHGPNNPCLPGPTSPWVGGWQSYDPCCAIHR